MLHTKFYKKNGFGVSRVIQETKRVPFFETWCIVPQLYLSMVNERSKN